MFKDHIILTRGVLVHPKDKTPILDKVGVMYPITGADCNIQYEGETETAVKKRDLATLLNYKHHFSHANITYSPRVGLVQQRSCTGCWYTLCTVCSL